MELLRKIGLWIGWVCTVIGAIDLPEQMQKWAKYFASLAGIVVNWDADILGEYGRWGFVLIGVTLILIANDVPKKLRNRFRAVKVVAPVGNDWRTVNSIKS